MKFISLFSGIGGFDLGFERAGMECVAQVEIDDKAEAGLVRRRSRGLNEQEKKAAGKDTLKP